VKRFLLAVTVVLTAGCNSTPTSSGAGIVGAHDMVQAGRLMFTTSTDRDELRVLDLEPPNAVAGVREWVRAPNPLETLSIPVLGRPSALARDSQFVDAVVGDVMIPRGAEVAGPFVYASRSGGSEISIVGADPAQLIEVQRMPTSAPVTATAGLVASPTISRLFYATYDGTAAYLHSVDLPATVPGLKAKAPGDLTKAVVTYPAFPGEVIVELVLVPGIPGRGICEAPEKTCAILATRTMQGRAGRVLLFDPETNNLRELHFPSAVRLLAVHAGTQGRAGYLAPGQRVFGVLDEESCTVAACGGVVAVDTFTGQIALDSAGLPMIPISAGAALITGLSVVARGETLLPPALIPVDPPVASPTPFALVAAGVMTTSNGTFIIFDAEGLTPIDLNATSTFADPINLGFYEPNGVLHVSDGGVPSYVAGPAQKRDGGLEVTFRDGAFKSETIDIVVNGLIPGLSDLPVPNASDTEFVVDDALVSRVMANDILIFKTATGACQTTVASVTGNSIRAAAVDACAGRSRFAVRAAGAEPYIVQGTLTGYMGRAAPNTTFRYFGGYFARTPPFDRNAPTFTVQLGAGDARVEKDWRWSIDVQPALSEFVFRVDPSAVGCSTNVASSVIWDVGHVAIFSVFPSANAVIEVNPRTASPARQGLTGSQATCWR